MGILEREALLLLHPTEYTFKAPYNSSLRGTVLLSYTSEAGRDIVPHLPFQLKVYS